MSDYIKKPHGLMIGRANVFFYWDEDDDLREFPSIVSVSPLFFDSYTSLHAGIRSTAEQLLFDMVPYIEEGLENYRITTYKGRLRHYWIGWLDENCPGWGYPPLKNADRIPSLFFAKYRHAKAFTEHVAEVLKGERYAHD